LHQTQNLSEKFDVVTQFKLNIWKFKMKFFIKKSNCA